MNRQDEWPLMAVRFKPPELGELIKSTQSNDAEAKLRKALHAAAIAAASAGLEMSIRIYLAPISLEPEA